MGKRVSKRSKAEFAKLLKDWRERRGFTQEQAAAKLGINLRTLQNWEIARNAPQGFAKTAVKFMMARPD
ncbi:MAG: helix-turn-helix domain-containing protein [Verrucomicrobiia bacterium]